MFKINLNTPFFVFIKQQRLSVIGFLLSLFFLITISSTFLADAIYFNDPRHQNVDLKAWMTPRYVSLSYKLPKPVMVEVLGINLKKKYPKRMDKLAARQGLTLKQLTDKVRAAQASYLENNND